jgi:hypothetical protein
MSVFYRRTKIISFRVSEEEYGHLLRVSSESGAHSVSDWARAATFAQSGNPSLMAGNSHQLQARVEELHREVLRLSELIGVKS